MALEIRQRRAWTHRARVRRAGLAVLAVLAVTVLSTGLVVAGSLPAQASCAADPAASPYAFTGLVVGTRLGGRIATVRLDSGATVEVRGTTVNEENVASSVDRTYVVGGRYEFHPYNATSPYQDSVCSRTVLRGTESVPSAAVPAMVSPAVPSSDAPPSPSSTVSALAVTTGAAVLAGGLALGIRWRERRRSRRPAGQGRTDTFVG